MIEQVLAWCNEKRAEKGMEALDQLPKGARRDGESCPCGLATGLFVGGGVYAESKEKFYADVRIRTPDVITDFVREFDNGVFPDLIDHRREAYLYEAITSPGAPG